MIELIAVLAEMAMYLLFGLLICVALLPKEYRGKIVDMFRYRFTKIEFEETVDGLDTKGFRRNGKFHGTLTSWNKSGQIRLEVNYKNGKKDGLCQKWDELGHLMLQGYFTDGEKQGLFIDKEEWLDDFYYCSTYNLGSHISTICLNDDDRLAEYFDEDEVSIVWSDNGQIHTLRLAGDSYAWYDSGQIERHISYIGDQTNLYTLWYENGQKQFEGKLIRRKLGWKDGKWTWWFENGQIEQEGNYKNDKLDGKLTRWYESGQKSMEGNYKDGKAGGKVTEWYENGQIEWEGNYKDDKRDGKWTKWYENGQIKYEGNYKDDKEDGKATEWDKSGNKIL